MASAGLVFRFAAAWIFSIAPFRRAGRRAILISPCAPVPVQFFSLSDVVFARIVAARKKVKMLGDSWRSGVTT